MAIEQTAAGGAGTEMTTLRMVIGGETVDAADGQTFEVVNPATGESIATAPLGGKVDVDRAVEAAQKAFEDPKGWANWPAGKRGRSLAKLGELVKKNSEELAQLESRNTGKPITSARGEIAGVWLVFDYYAGAANKIYGQTIPVAKPGLDLTLKEPIGVVRADRALELPDVHGQLEGRAGARRRATPRSSSRPRTRPMTAMRLGELALEAGIPPGVLNVVTGPGRHRRRLDRRASRASARSPSPARRRPARRSCGWPRTT